MTVRWKVLGSLALAAAAAVVGILWLRQDEGAVRPPSGARSDLPAAQPGAVEVRLMPAAAEAARLNTAEIQIAEDLEIVDGLLGFYRRLFDENPVGLNHEIVRALAGRNAMGAAFLAPDHPAINDRGGTRRPLGHAVLLPPVVWPGDGSDLDGAGPGIVDG